MMNLLLDTHVLIWTYIEPEKIGTKAFTLLDSTESSLYVSSVSAAEIACLVESQKLDLRNPVKVWCERAIRSIGASWLDLTAADAIGGWTLPGSFHRDPSDRLLVSQAHTRGWHLATADQRILSYSHVKTINALK